MPKRYEQIREWYKSQGYSDAKAKEIAARTENKLRKKEGKPPMKPHRKSKKR